MIRICTSVVHHSSVIHTYTTLAHVHKLLVMGAACLPVVGRAVDWYRRVRIKRPWAGNLRMQRKRGVGAKCVVRRKWHVVSAHHPEKAGIFDNHFFYYNHMLSR